MSRTLAGLRTQTRTYLDEVSQADWLDTEVDTAINNAYHDVVTAVIETYEDYYVIKTTLDSVANQQEYGTADGLPTNIFKFRRVELNYNVSDSNSIARRCKPISMDAVLRDLGNSALGITVYRNPSYYSYGFGSGANGRKIGFIPQPTRAGTGAIALWYIPEQTDLSSASDEPNIPYADRYASLIPMGAAIQLLRKGQQEEAVANAYNIEYETELTKMRQQLEDTIADDAKGVIDTVGEDVDFTSGGYF